MNKREKIGNFNYSQQKAGGGNHSLFQQRSSSLALSSVGALSPVRKGQKGRALGSKSHFSASYGHTFRTCKKCGKNYLLECLMGKNECFGYGSLGQKL